jgi:hypothetical protein
MAKTKSSAPHRKNVSALFVLLQTLIRLWLPNESSFFIPLQIENHPQGTIQGKIDPTQVFPQPFQCFYKGEKKYFISCKTWIIQELTCQFAACFGFSLAASPDLMGNVYPWVMCDGFYLSISNSGPAGGAGTVIVRNNQRIP